MAKPAPLAACVLFGLVAAGCAAPAGPDPAAITDDSPEGQLQSLVFLAGSWAGWNEASLWEAHYTSPAGGLLLGTTKRYTQGIVTFFEFEEFRVEGGALIVTPYLGGDRSAVFKLKSLDREQRRVVFENVGHEPQNIEYWQMKDDVLVISVTTPIAPSEPGSAPKVKGFRIALKRL